MLPEMKMTTKTANDGVNAPEDEKAMKQYMALSKESRKKVNELVEELLRNQERVN